MNFNEFYNDTRILKI